MNYAGTGVAKASTTAVKSATPKTTTTQRDIGKEILASLQAGTVDKTKQLMAERDAKIAANNMTGVKSTDDLIKGAGYSSEFFRGTLGNTTNNQTVDNSSMINSQYGNLISALKAKIQQSINNKNMQISQLGQKYQPQINENEVSRNNNLRSVLEQNANAGDRGGVGRQNALETQTSADNIRNTIEMNKANEEASLKNDIANLLLEGNVQEAQLGAQKLKDLIANNQYVDITNYSRNRDSIADSRYAAETAYSHNRDTVADNQWQQTFDWNKSQAQKEAEATAARVRSESDQALWDRAMETWKTSGVASNEVASILGVKPGAKTADYNLESIQTAYETNKPYYKPTSSGSSTPKPTKTEQANADFASDYSALKSMSVKDAVSAMNSKWNELIAKYGPEGAVKLWNQVLYDAIKMEQATKR